MKISFIADCHLNKTSYKDDESFMFTSLSFRPQDFMKSLEYMVDKNINEFAHNFMELKDVSKIETNFPKYTINNI